MTPILSVVIASQGRPERLKRVLEGLAAQTDLRFELILVQDGVSLSVSPPSGFPLHLTSSDGSGAARARNEGLRLASAQRVLVIDDDCVPHPEAVARHAKLAGNSVCAIGMRWRIPLNAVEALPGAPVAWETLCGLSKGRDERHEHIQRLKSRKAAPDRDDSNVAYTCHLSFPTASAKAIGGFWEAFPGSGFEDIEFALRLWRSKVFFELWDDFPVLHLDHPTCPKQVGNFNENRKLYFQTKQDRHIVERNGGLSHFRR